MAMETASKGRGGIKRLLEHLLTAAIVFLLTATWKVSIQLVGVGCNTACLLTTMDATAVEEKQHPTRFLLGIFSMQKDKERRDLIRSTMLGPDLPEATRSKMCSLQEYLAFEEETRCKCQIIYTFVIGGNSSAKMAYPANTTQLVVHNQFSEAEPDLTLLNIRENMNAGKTPSWFHYASTLSGIDYVGKSDSDALMSIPRLLEFVNQDLPPSRPDPRVYGGLLRDFFGCGQHEWCETIKDKAYMSGQFYFVSHDIANHISMNRLNTTFKDGRHEDLDFGIRVWGYQHAVKLIALNADSFWRHGLKSAENWDLGYRWMKHREFKIHLRKFETDIFRLPPGTEQKKGVVVSSTIEKGKSVEFDTKVKQKNGMLVSSNIEKGKSAESSSIVGSRGGVQVFRPRRTKAVSR